MFILCIIIIKREISVIQSSELVRAGFMDEILLKSTKRGWVLHEEG